MIKSNHTPNSIPLFGDSDVITPRNTYYTEQFPNTPDDITAIMDVITSNSIHKKIAYKIISSWYATPRNRHFTSAKNLIEHRHENETMWEDINQAVLVCLWSDVQNGSITLGGVDDTLQFHNDCIKVLTGDVIEIDNGEVDPVYKTVKKSVFFHCYKAVEMELGKYSNNVQNLGGYDAIETNSNNTILISHPNYTDTIQDTAYNPETGVLELSPELHRTFSTWCDKVRATYTTNKAHNLIRVFNALLMGDNKAQIAKTLGLSEHTLDNYITAGRRLWNELKEDGVTIIHKGEYNRLNSSGTLSKHTYKYTYAIRKGEPDKKQSEHAQILNAFNNKRAPEYSIESPKTMVYNIDMIMPKNVKVETLYYKPIKENVINKASVKSTVKWNRNGGSDYAENHSKTIERTNYTTMLNNIVDRLESTKKTIKESTL